DLGAALIVGGRHVEAEGRLLGALAVLAADQRQNFPVAPEPGVLMDEAVGGLNPGLLEQLQPERLADPSALRLLAEPLDELDGPVGPLQVEDPGVRRVVEVANQPLKLLADA